MIPPDNRAVFSIISCPTVFIVGREDSVCAPHIRWEMAEKMGNAPVVLIENSGHLSNIEQPEAITAGPRYWLQIY
jgi:pimeloyl-ACP methyl ester carboxylesterase